jgi:hypothetical protein
VRTLEKEFGYANDDCSGNNSSHDSDDEEPDQTCKVMVDKENRNPQGQESTEHPQRRWYDTISWHEKQLIRSGTPPRRFFEVHNLLRLTAKQESTVPTSNEGIYEEEDFTDPLYITGIIAHKRFDVMIDSGASANYISQALVDRFNLVTHRRKNKTWVVLVNDDPVTVDTETFAQVNFSTNYKPVLRFHIIDMRYQAILGRGWLKETADFVSINRKDSGVRIGFDFVQGYEIPRYNDLISAQQFKRAMKTQQPYLQKAPPHSYTENLHALLLELRTTRQR